MPGPIVPGEWAVELGVAAVISQALGDSDGKVGWRVEIELSSDPAFADEPYEPAPYDSTPARAAPGWYAGDMHVHAEHSALGDATMTETFGFAFKPLSESGAGLDFITLSDYVVPTPGARSAAASPTIRQADRPQRGGDHLPRPHQQPHQRAYVDYRTGPIFELEHDGTLIPRRAAAPPRELFADVHAAGGFTQINHPTIFPSNDPVLPAVLPWLPVGLHRRGDRLLEGRRDRGEHRAAAAAEPVRVERDRVLRASAGPGREDRRGRCERLPQRRPHGGFLSPQAPVGTPPRWCTRTSCRRRDPPGRTGRHTYVKLTGNKGPDVRFTAGPGKKEAEHAA